MQKPQKAILAALIVTSVLAWIASIQQPDMMAAMTTYNPLAISLFAASWTAGMAAMMFPAIAPMVLLYNRFVTNSENKRGQSSVMVQEEGAAKSSSIRSARVIIFIGSYLVVWALTGVALLIGWSIVMNYTVMSSGNSQVLAALYGGLLITAGVYQFTPLKRTCIGYCESPMSFFMRRWRDGTSGAVKMGIWHGAYCLGCCWVYFLLMVALGWMNLLWMGLFAGIIFGEKIWSKGIWIARAAGLGLIIVGLLVIAGLLPSLVTNASTMSTDTPMAMTENEMGGEMTIMNNGVTEDNSIGSPADGSSNPAAGMENMNTDGSGDQTMPADEDLGMSSAETG